MNNMSPGSTSKKRRALPGGSAGRGISFSAAAGVSSLIAGLLLLPVVIATIGSQQYGIWLFLLAIASILLYADLGMGTGIVHFLSRIRGGDNVLSRDAVVSSSYVWSFSASLVASAVFWICGSLYLFGEKTVGVLAGEERTLLLGAGLLITLSMILRPFGSILTGSGLLHIERQTQIAAVVVRVVGTLGACKFIPTVVAIAYVEAVALAVPYIAALVVVCTRRLVVIRPKLISISIIKTMLTYSIGAFGVAVTGAGIQQVGTVIVGLLGDSTAVTAFNAAMRISGSARQVMNWISDPFRSVLSRLYAARAQGSYIVLRDFSLVILFAGTITAFSLIIAAPQLAVLWLGESMDAESIAVATSLLLLALLLNALHLPLIPAVDAAGRSGAFFVQQSVWLILYVLFSCILFPSIGIIGVAFSMLFPLPLIECWYFYKARQILFISSTDWVRGVILPVIPSIVCGCFFVVVARWLNPSILVSFILSVAFVILGFLSLMLTDGRWWSWSSLKRSLRSAS